MLNVFALESTVRRRFTGDMGNQNTEKRIRILLLVEQGLFRASLAHLLALEPDFEIIDGISIEESADAAELPNGYSADVVLSDFDLGIEQMMDLISKAGRGGQGKVLIVAETADAENSADALKVGASGIFLKSQAPDRLIQAIRLVATGVCWIDPSIIQMLADKCISQPFDRPGPKSIGLLQKREHQVVSGILSGFTNKEIAKSMAISESSVKNILQGLFSRTNVRTRSQLVRLALEGSLGDVRQFANRRAKGPRMKDISDSERPDALRTV